MMKLLSKACLPPVTADAALLEMLGANQYDSPIKHSEK
jgi:hypothetical protein